MSSLRPVLLALLFSGLVAPAATAAPSKDGFRLETAVDAATNKVRVAIAVDPEYHWNTEYPAKIEVKGDLPAGLVVPKRLFKAKDGDIVATGQRATVEIPFQRGRGSGEVALEAKFSICNDRVCLMKTATARVRLGP